MGCHDAQAHRPNAARRAGFDLAADGGACRLAVGIGGRDQVAQRDREGNLQAPALVQQGGHADGPDLDRHHIDRPGTSSRLG
jgi:hypothetical protein